MIDRPVRWLVALALGGCVSQLPPPEPPSRQVDPELVAQAFDAEPGEGEGVVVLEVDGDGPAHVEDLGSELDGAGATQLCDTPCVTTLRLGDHRLVMHQAGRDDEVSLTVSRTPRAHRRVMSYQSAEHTEYIALAVSGLTLGLLGLPILDPLIDSTGNSTGADVGLSVGAGLVGAALVAGLVGVVLLIVDPREQREGASVEWELSPP